MRRFIFASHHKLAYGLKDTVNFLTNNAKEIYDINAYCEDDNKELDDVIKELFESFNIDDEVVILSDMMGGSVNLKFMPYMNENIHLVAGANLPVAMSIILMNEEEKLTSQALANVINECKNQVVYINQMNSTVDDDDE